MIIVGVFLAFPGCFAGFAIGGLAGGKLASAISATPESAVALVAVGALIGMIASIGGAAEIISRQR